jgi:hypothetical protein
MNTRSSTSEQTISFIRGLNRHRKFQVDLNDLQPEELAEQILREHC